MKVDGLKIKMAIARKKMNVPEVASLIGFTPEGLRKLIHRERTTLSTLGLLAEVLEVDPVELISDGKKEA